MKTEDKDLKNDPLKEDTSTQDDKNSETQKVGQDNKNNDEIKIPKHRFDEVNEEAKTYKKQAEQLEKKLKQMEKKDLEEKEQYRELYEKTKEELKEVEKSRELARKESSVIKEAYRVGVREDALDDIVKLIDLDEVDTDNISSTIDEFTKEKPYLLSKGSTNIGTKTTKSKEDVETGNMWKESEIQRKSTNHNWWTEHKDEIKKARAEGRVINDLK